MNHFPITRHGFLQMLVWNEHSLIFHRFRFTETDSYFLSNLIDATWWILPSQRQPDREPGLIHPADGLIEGAATPSPVSAEVAGRGAVSLVSLITDKVALTAADNGWEGAWLVVSHLFNLSLAQQHAVIWVTVICLGFLRILPHNVFVRGFNSHNELNIFLSKANLEEGRMFLYFIIYKTLIPQQR